MSWIEKFFNYSVKLDGLGKGVIDDYRWWIWLIAFVGLAVGGYFLFKKYKKAGKITIIVVVSLLLATRTINQIVRACVGAENPWWRAFPFHLCTLMTFLLPLTILCKWDKIKNPVFVLSMMGAMITLFVNDYCANLFVNFGAIEGACAHTILFVVPIWEMAIGEFKLNWKKSWEPIAGVFVCMAWAMFANLILKYVYGMDANYMYLMKNALPIKLPGITYLLVYVAIFFVFLTAIYGIPELWRFLKRKYPVLNGKQAVATAGAENAQEQAVVVDSTVTEELAVASDERVETQASEQVSEKPAEKPAKAKKPVAKKPATKKTTKKE